MFKFVLCFAVLAISLSPVRAKISQESELILLKHLESIITECRKELHLEVGPLQQKHITFGKIDDTGKCFAGCILKKAGLINAEGKFDYDKDIEVMKKVITNKDDLKILETDSKACLSVNDEEVSDGNKGCERATKLLKCMIKQK